MSQTNLAFADLLATARHSAAHLELRDSYRIDKEAAEFGEWQTGWRPEPDPAAWWNEFHTWVRDATARGVVLRRARVVSEPASAYVRYEHDCTYQNIAAGESVRWLPRRKASDLALPGNDFWLFDDRLVMWNHFTGEGASAGPELDEREAVAKFCAEAFEAVWNRATPHDEYRI
ncbi:DUF6879 family protein [Streptomyces sp. NBC_00893]|uniref:DUF6879 family protein n=1 Tax=Streptomyces sp. NBC_00893 TaxID=2975862 RepID=UPI0022577AF6|nr:DUF6879 family protein [Streptomyces sp. NBC_00893]MCX4846860.1 hypothetical protein [Streptomyces sp. NBC_00893]